MSRNGRRGFTREFLSNLDGVERKAQSIRREFERRAAVNHPDPEFRADPGDLESVLRSYAELGYDPQGYPTGWTGPRAVDGSWSPYATWEGRPARRVVAAKPASPPARRVRIPRGAKWRAATPERVEDLICEAWQDLSVKSQDWIRLARLRPRVDELAAAARVEVTREMMDSALIAMIKRVLPTLDGFEAGCVHLAPDSNRKALTVEDHEAAIRVGTEDKHLLAIEEDYFAAAGYRKKRGRRWVR